MPTAYKIHNLTFAATLAQFNTALSTTLPGSGVSVIQAPVNFSGIILLNNFTFTATTNSIQIITAISNINALYAGLAVTAANVPAGTTILSVNTAGGTATLSQAATSSVVGETFTAQNSIGQVDFTYDGFGFLRFFSGAPASTSMVNPTGPGLIEDQMSNALVQFLTNLLTPTLGAPVAANQANSFPPFRP